MTAQYHVFGQFDGVLVAKDYFVSDLPTARRAARHDGAKIVYHITKIRPNWFFRFRSGNYGMLLLRAINFQVDAGIPAAKAVQTAIESETDVQRRSKLQGGLDALARGASIADALFATGLYDSTVYSILMTGERIGGASAIRSAIGYLSERRTAWKNYWVILSWMATEMSTALTLPPIIKDTAIPYIRTHLPKGTPAAIAGYQHQLDVIDFNNLVWMWITGFMLFIASVITIFWFTHPPFKDWFARRVLTRMPLLGDWYANDALARSCKVFADLLTAGVRMPDAVQTILKAASNSVAKRFWSTAQSALNSGALPGSAFTASGILRQDETLVLKTARSNLQFAAAFIAMADERTWHQKMLSQKIFKMSLVWMFVYIGITLLIGFHLFDLFNKGLDMTMDSTLKGL
jgi:hypothetical protein